MVLVTAEYYNSRGVPMIGYPGCFCLMGGTK